MHTAYLHPLAWILPLLLLPTLAPADDRPAPPDDRRIEELRIHTEGDPDPAAWQHLTDQQQAAAVLKLKDSATAAQKAEHLKMRFVETTHFLIYFDNGVAANLVHEDSGYLEAAYTALNKVFTVKGDAAGQGSNVWQGKALLYIFSDIDIARDFLRVMYHQDTDATPLFDIQSLPLVTLNKSGSVAMVVAQTDVFRDTKREMVLAMADAFLFRLRSPTPVAPWVESGLALAIADSIHYQGNQYTPSDADLARNLQSSAARYLRSNDINRLLGSKAPAPWACEGLISFLIGQSPAEMAKFVLAMKDGKTWEDAMKDIYQLTPAELKADFLIAATNNR